MGKTTSSSPGYCQHFENKTLFHSHLFWELKNQTLEVCVCPTFVSTIHFLRLLQSTAFYTLVHRLCRPVLNCEPQSCLSLTLQTWVKDSSSLTRREYWTYILHWRNKSKSHRSRIRAFFKLENEPGVKFGGSNLSSGSLSFYTTHYLESILCWECPLTLLQPTLLYTKQHTKWPVLKHMSNKIKFPCNPKRTTYTLHRQEE